MFNVNKSLKRILKDTSKNRKCLHCGDEIGDGDEYDSYRNHMPHCNSKIGRKASNSRDEEE